MISIDKLDTLTTEQFARLIAENNAAIRDLLNDNELIVKHYLDDHFMTADEVADMLHCAVTSIPKDILCTRIGRGYVYKKSNVMTWISRNTKARKGD